MKKKVLSENIGSPVSETVTNQAEKTVTVADVLAEISDAENKAREIRDNAKQTARDIAKSAVEESEALKGEYASATKREIKEILTAANEKADGEERETKKAAEQSARDSVRTAERNVRSVGEWLADMLVKGKY